MFYSYGNNPYEGLSFNSTDEERLNIVFNFLRESRSPQWLHYDKLFVRDERERIFDAKLKQTGFVYSEQPPTALQPHFKLNDEGVLMLDKYGSYKDYLDAAKMESIEIPNQKGDTHNYYAPVGNGNISINDSTLTSSPISQESDFSSNKITDNAPNINPVSNKTITIIKKVFWFIIIPLALIIIGIIVEHYFYPN